MFAEAGFTPAEALNEAEAEARTPMMDTVEAAAAQARIRDLDGHEHELKETWAQRPVVLAFVRHFG